MIMFWKEIVIVLLISTLGYFGFNKVYSMGYEKAAVVYEAKIKEYDDNLNKRVENIEKLSTDIFDLSVTSREVASKEYKAIISATKGRPLYTVNSGVCNLSTDFVKAYNEAVNRANKK
jgi:hypothetical protein